MKSCSAALANFLENTTTFFRADLYTFTLAGGAILRWSGASQPVTASIQVAQQPQGPFTWNLGPPIGDKGVQNTRGVQPATVDITIACGDGRFQVAGVDVRDFIFGLGLDGALIRIDRAYAASAAAMAANGPVGTYCRFSGRYSEAKEIGPTQVVVAATDWRDCLQTDYPKVAYQSSCNNTFGDSNCGVNLAALTVTGAISGTPTPSVFNTGHLQPTGFFNLGAVTFTSGVNAGLSRSIKSFVTGGMVTTQTPFPAAPAVGDAYSMVPGCLLSMGTLQGQCGYWQAEVPSGTPWMQRYRATPFVPPPSTGLPT